ncbi:MAG: 2-phospho-L-lactate transferase [Actinobacteria bacterium]|nr:MAG: 2-phospho-L-lactate transferase [Actinomycetota bacterium]
MRVALLAGGTGGAKLAAGVQELVGPDLSVIANTADDTRIHGLYVSPDPDLVTYWLAGEIDEERGWGIRDDTFVVNERLERLGAPGWFQLSDRDLATCLYRTHFMAEGGTLTAAQAQIARSLGATARVLPIAEERVATRVLTPAGWRGLQEFLIVDRSEPEIEAVEVQGIADASPTPEVLEALAAAEAIVIGPSNPVISIGPIVAVPGLREAMMGSGVPIVAVSPFVAGRAVKGPTEKFMAAVRRPSSAAGVASLYEGLISAMVVDADDPDEGPEGVQVLSCPTLMEGADGRRELAERVLEFAEALG